MRLAFVKKSFSVHGGAELYLKTMLGALKLEGHELHVFANKWALDPGLIFHKVDILRAGSFLSARSFVKKSARQIESKNFDCVVSFERTECQDIYRAGDGCHRAWLEIRTDFESAYRRLSFRINPFHRYILALEERIFADTPLIVVNSKLVKKQIQQYYGTPDNKIAVAYNGVDLEVYTPDNKSKFRTGLRQAYGVSDSDKVILFVGSGFGRKGVGTLIKSLPQVQSNSKERVFALIVGKGDAAGYQALAKRLGVSDNVIFAGAQPDTARYYAAADIFVLPTIYDPFSNACLEAMASGLPVITSKNNGVAEIIEYGKEGFVTSLLNDSAELADKIVSAVQDSEAMGKCARKKAEEFSIQRAAEEFMRLIRITAECRHEHRTAK
jgi:UDP-glucose:(heptosyl)LPS alpha-1,3-glucosyltransferase